MISLQKKSRIAAFTLIELLVVISIISLLASIAMSSLRIAQKKAQNTAILASLNQFAIWLEVHRTVYDRYPSGSCPASGEDCRICRTSADSNWPISDMVAEDPFPSTVPALLGAETQAQRCITYITHSSDPGESFGLEVALNYINDDELQRTSALFANIFAAGRGENWCQENSGLVICRRAF